MERKQDGLVPIGEALADLDGPVQAIRKTPPPARRSFTVADQVNQLVSASEADPDLGFMARMMALCSLPRTNPGNQHRYVRRNGPYTLVMSATGLHKLPFGNLPRLILAWLCTEAVRTQSRELVLGRSLAEFMRTLGYVRRCWIALPTALTSSRRARSPTAFVGRWRRRSEGGSKEGARFWGHRPALRPSGSAPDHVPKNERR